MGIDPLTLTVGGAVIGGASSVASAASQNQSLERSMRSTVAGSQEALNQLQFQTAVATQRYTNDSRKIRGAIRVSAAGAGMSGADLAALQRQAAFDADLNIRLAKADAMNKAKGILAQTDAAITGLSDRTSNPLLAGFTGALKGALAGYEVGQMKFPSTNPTNVAGGGGWQEALAALP